MAIERMKSARMMAEVSVRQYVAAVRCGIVEGAPVLDLDYTEDFQASTDLNCVMTEDGRLVELQATAEGAPYSRAELESMLALAGKGIKDLIVGQKRAIAALGRMDWRILGAHAAPSGAPLLAAPPTPL